MQVAIVGGSIAGAGLGLALHARGVSYAIFERSAAPRLGGGALLMWPNAMHVLGRLGLAAEVEALGSPASRADIYDSKGERLVSLPVDAVCERLGGRAIVVPRRELVRLMVERAAPSIHYSKQCIQVHALDRRASILFDGGTEIDADLVVGADGVTSTVRRELFGRDDTRYAGQVAYVGRARGSAVALRPGVMEAYLGVGQRFWATPTRNGDAYWYAVVAEADAPGSAMSPRDLASRYRGWRGPAATLVGSTAPEDITVTPVRDRRPGRPWRRGAATLLGDAAHAVTPDLGQGACQALESAAVLADAIVEIGANRAALARYEGTRRPRAEALNRLCWAVATRSMTARSLETAFWSTALRLTPDAWIARELEWIVGGVRGLPALPRTAVSDAWPAR